MKKNSSIRLPEEIDHRLRTISAETDRTKTSIIKAALNHYLPRLELELLAQREICKLIEQKVSGGAAG
jgi:predicted DNA-binding protein